MDDSTNKMKFGLYLPNFGAFGNARVMADLAGDAEQAGWDGFFIWDHINRTVQVPVVDPWVALSAVAMATHTIRIGALITPIPRRRPWKLARETVSLDWLSEGRLIVGAGIGGGSGAVIEWANFGEQTDLHTRGEMLDESLAILTGLWSGEPFSFDGRHYHVDESLFLPRPLQFPRIPIWVGGNWPNKAPFRRAARWDGVVPVLTSTTEDDLAQMENIIAFTHSQIETPHPLDVIYSAAPIPDEAARETARRAASFAAAGVTWWLDKLNPQYFGGDWESKWPIDAMRRHILQGPPVG